ncbi:MAG: carboxymuconolactone decarboxylase family protein [Betaproteobacteria bacterium]|jgi:4-carboxymuconolactone decarboxylase
MKKSADFEKGLAIRKKVLGEPYVNRTLKNTNALLLPFQEMLTEFAWGKVWTRPGLTLKERSMLTLGMCIALNRPNEIKIHLRGAVRNGCSEIELRELLIHSFIYCGGPASVDAFHVLLDALPEIIASETVAKKAKPATKKKSSLTKKS